MCAIYFTSIYISVIIIIIVNISCVYFIVKRFLLFFFEFHNINIKKISIDKRDIRLQFFIFHREKKQIKAGDVPAFCARLSEGIHVMGFTVF